MDTKIKKKLERNIWKFYLFDIAGAMLFVVPVIVLFWQQNGLGLTQVTILQAFFSIVMVILEVPTGYLADVHGRKNILFLSGVSFVLAITSYALGYSFAAFLVAEFFFALALSLYSGTSSAFIYDTLAELKREDEFSKIWGNAKFYGLLAMAFSQIIGGFVGNINLRWGIYMSVPFYLLLIPITLSLYEPSRHKMVVEKDHLRKVLSIFKFTLLENVKLRWLTMYGAVVYALYSAGLWLYQPYFKLSGVDVVYFGIIFASFQLVAALSSKYAHKIEKTFGARISLIALVLITFLGYLLMSKFVFFWSFLFIYTFQFVRGFSDPVFTDYTNKLTTSDIRATVLSVQSLFERLVYAIIVPFIGWAADVYCLTRAFSIAAVTTLVCGAVILGILRKDKVI